MKYKGDRIKGPEPEIVAFPRNKVVDGETVPDDLVFIISAVLDYSPFEAICPEPSPKVLINPKGEQTLDPSDKEFESKHAEWGRNKLNWIYLKSLSGPNPGDLEWETVSMTDPSTWQNWQEELKDAHLTPAQVQYIRNRVLLFNGLDQEKMNEAKNRFLALTQSKRQ